MIVILIVLGIGAFFLYSYLDDILSFFNIHPSEEGIQRIINAQKCRHNLKLIEAAKEAWARDHGKVYGEKVTWKDLYPYLGRTTPLTCPSGGTYILNSYGINAQCTIGINGTPDDPNDDHILRIK